MNKHIQIGATLTAIYFLMLPLLFFVHAFHHEPIAEYQQEAELVITDAEADCCLCDQYHHQHIQLAGLGSFYFAEYFLSCNFSIAEFTPYKVIHGHPKRGPPMA